MGQSEHYQTHLMAAKMCHDLATPLSAMNLLLDFAFEHCKDPHIESTFRESLEKSSHRIQFYRLLLSANETLPCYADVFQLLCGCARLSKVAIDLPIDCPDGVAARLLLGLSYLMIEALTKGGELLVTLDDDSLIFKSEATSFQMRKGYLEMLQHPDSQELNVRNILPYYIAKLAESLRVSIHVEIKNHTHLIISTQTLQ